MKGIVIETERLILRNLRLEDAEAMFEYASSPNVGPHAGWQPHKNIDETKEYLKTCEAKPLLFGIVWKETGKVVGQIELKDSVAERFVGMEVSQNSKELGYVLSDKFWGRGIMPEAGRALIDYAFNVLNLDEVVCCHSEANTQSGRVQEKLGLKIVAKQEKSFDYLGEKTDLIQRKLTKEDWAKSKTRAKV